MNRCATVILILVAFISYSKASDRISVKKAESEIIFDGIPNEEAWKNTKPLPLVTQVPVFGEKPSEKTEIMILYDDQYFYLGARMYDKEPDKIMANSYKRDAFIGNTDWVGFVIDSYNDKQNGLGFFTNPNGLRLDANVVNDAYGREPINTNWNAVWDVATKRTDEGWFVEIRVPFSSIPFQQIDGSVTMGLIAWRYIARKNEVDIFPEISNEYGEWAEWKPSLSREVQFDDVKRKKPLYIAPYMIGGYSSEALEYESPESGYYKDDDLKIEAGLDIRYGITNNINLDVTLNTDFAQVEADDEQVNLTRFSLFFPEKRMFFQERAGIFDFSFGRRDQLFYSRRIGIFDDRPVRIYGGARVVGRAGNLDVGLINMQTEGIDTIGSYNHSVIRLKKQIINENSDMGLLITNQMDFNGFYNTNVGIDSRIKIGKQEFLSVKYAQTFESGSNRNILDLDAGRWFVSVAKQNKIGWIYSTSFSTAGRNFNPTSGYMQRENFSRWAHSIGHGWTPGENSFIQAHDLKWRGTWYRNNLVGETDSYSGALDWSLRGKKSFQLEVKVNYSYENIIEEFDISDNIIIHTGKYKIVNAEIGYTSPYNKAFYATYKVDYGKFYEGSKLTFEFSPRWTATSNFELHGTYILNYLSLTDISETLQIMRVKGLYMFNTKFSLSSFLQYNSVSKTMVTNFRLRYNPQEGNDLYLVINDDLNTERRFESLRLPLSNQRTVLLKYTYTFRP